MMKDTIEILLKKAGGVSSALAQIADAARELEARHRTETKARGRLLYELEPADAVVVNMCQRVDATSAAWAEDHGGAIARSFSRSFKESRGELREQAPGMFRLVGFVALEDLCGLVPDLIKSRLAELIRAAVGDKGVPVHDRERLIAEADERIADLELAHTILVDSGAASSPPISLRYLPVVRQRREAEDARQRQEAAAIEARRKIEERLNEEAAAAAVASAPGKRSTPVPLDPSGTPLSRAKVGTSDYLRTQQGERPEI